MTQTLHEDIRKVLDRQGTTDPSFDSIACLLLGIFDVQVAVVYTLDPGTGMLKLRCHRGFNKTSAEKIRFMTLGKGQPGKAASTRQPIQGCSLADANSMPNAMDLDVFPNGTLFVPMLYQNALKGVMGIAKGFHHEFAPDDITSLASIAQLIATYLK